MPLNINVYQSVLCNFNGCVIWRSIVKMLCNSYNSKILCEEFRWTYLWGGVRLLLVTVSNRLILDIEIVHSVSCHPIVVNQSIRGCLSSRATSRLIIECIETAGSDDNVRIWFREEPGFKLLTVVLMNSGMCVCVAVIVYSICCMNWVAGTRYLLKISVRKYSMNGLYFDVSMNSQFI